jgi:hypothetical protein
MDSPKTAKKTPGHPMDSPKTAKKTPGHPMDSPKTVKKRPDMGFIRRNTYRFQQ